jgi:hypothetical protein
VHPSCVITLSWHTSVKKLALSTSKSLTGALRPFTIIESANKLARECVEEYNAKLMVFQALCAKFEEAAQQFPTGPQRRFAQYL